MIKKLIHIISLTIILTPNLGISQFNFNISYNGNADDNLYRSPIPVQDYISIFGIGTNYKVQDTGLSIYNNFDVLNYYEYTYRSFLLNNLGFSNYINFTEDHFSKIYFGGNWNLRINKEEYNYYNYSQITGYTNVQHFFSIALLKGGYSYRLRNYTNWSDLSNQLHNAFIQLNKSFPTRTTIIIESRIGNKSFTGKDSITTTVVKGQGNGRRSGTSEFTNEIEKSLNTTQLNFTFRVTQSISDMAGLYIQYNKQISLDDETGYSNFDDYYQDDELFDDPFTFESDNFSSQLTLMLKKTTKIVFNGTYADKYYISEIAFVDEYDTIGIGEQRSDKQYKLSVKILKSFNLNKDWFKSIKFDLYYNYINNESNSYWYNYLQSGLGGGVQIGF